jgi:hypothetical protein
MKYRGRRDAYEVEAGTRRTDRKHDGVQQKDIKRGQPIADLPVAKRTAEQALADTSTPIPPPTTIAPTVVLPASQRDEIRQRVSSFKTHQEKIAREREEYYLQVKASMLAPVDPSGFRSEINPREPYDR